ncbi:hypothetical protein HDV05_000445 [Chytridiales sp. JEL 0842]|nr:hypothetical protein HDV05_000445 [Chytridiales sp. JEL 0842]
MSRFCSCPANLRPSWANLLANFLDASIRSPRSAVALNTRSRSLFSLGAKSAKPDPSDPSASTPSDSDPLESMHKQSQLSQPPPLTSFSSYNEKNLFHELQKQFMNTMEKPSEPEDAWTEYSHLVENMLEKVNLSIVSHRRLIGEIARTPTPKSSAEAITTKNTLLSKLIARLGSQATSQEFLKLAMLFETQNDVERLKLLISEMQDVYGLAPNIQTYNCLLRMYIKSGSHNLALELFSKLDPFKSTAATTTSTEQFPSADTNTYAAMFRLHYAQKNHEALLKLWTNMQEQKILPPPICYHLLMGSYMRMGKPLEAANLFRELKSKPGARISLGAFKTGISSLLASGASSQVWNEALDVLTMMESMNKVDSLSPLPDLQIYHTFMKSALIHLVQVGNPESLQPLLDLFRKLESSSATISPDAITYYFLIAGACKTRSPATALSYFQNLQSSRLVPTTETVSILISLLARQGLPEDCLDVFKSTLKMYKLNNLSDLTSVSLTAIMSPAAWNHVLHAFILSERWQEAWELVDVLEATEIQLGSSYVAVPLLKHAASKKTQTVEELLGHVESWSRHWKLAQTSATFGSLITLQQADLQSAFIVFTRFLKVAQPLDTTSPPAMQHLSHTATDSIFSLIAQHSPTPLTHTQKILFEIVSLDSKKLLLPLSPSVTGILEFAEHLLDRSSVNALEVLSQLLQKFNHSPFAGQPWLIALNTIVQSLEPVQEKTLLELKEDVLKLKRLGVEQEVGRGLLDARDVEALLQFLVGRGASVAVR